MKQKVTEEAKMLALRVKLTQIIHTSKVDSTAWNIAIFLLQNVKSSGSCTYLNIRFTEANKLIRIADSGLNKTMMQVFAEVFPENPNNPAPSAQCKHFWDAVLDYFKGAYGEDEGVIRYNLSVGCIMYGKTLNLTKGGVTQNVIWKGSGWYALGEVNNTPTWYVVAEPYESLMDAKGAARGMNAANPILFRDAEQVMGYMTT